jgi:hypothetical protein
MPSSVFTDIHIDAAGGGGGLPAPKVQTFRPDAIYDPQISDGQPSSGSLMKLPTKRFIKVTTPGLPQFILDDLATYKPQVELLRYTRSAGKRSLVTGQRYKNVGYVHPSHGPLPSGTGSFTHGGAHSVPQTLSDLRSTEWPILTGKDHIDVTQGMASFMAMLSVAWRDSLGNLNFTQLPCPTSSRMRRPIPGSRFPYSATFTPGYFAFRLSVIDPSDPRQKRIHGPESQVVSLTTNEFPFDPDGLDPIGKAACTLNTQPVSLNFWIGASSRLPSG